MQSDLSDHLHGIVIAQFTIKKKVHYLQGITNLCEHPLDMLLDETQRRTESHLPTVAILAPFGPSPLPTALLLWGLLHRSCSGLGHLFDQHRVRRAAFDTEQG